MPAPAGRQEARSSEEIGKWPLLIEGRNLIRVVLVEAVCPIASEGPVVVRLPVAGRQLSFYVSDRSVTCEAAAEHAIEHGHVAVDVVVDPDLPLAGVETLDSPSVLDH